MEHFEPVPNCSYCYKGNFILSKFSVEYYNMQLFWFLILFNILVLFHTTSVDLNQGIRFVFQWQLVSNHFQLNFNEFHALAPMAVVEHRIVYCNLI